MSTLSATSNKPLFDHFFNTSLDDLLTEQQRVNAEDKVLQLFQRCVLEVPAYRQFLAAKQIDSADISDYASFIHLPLMNKADYMQAYPLPDRCFGGSLKGADRIAVSSGSTGKPTFWPRSAAYELDIAVRFEQVFCDSFQAHNRNTLAIVCFALGNWVGGLFTTSCCWHLAHKGYPLMVATPGNNKAEIFRVVRELSPQFEQTVLLGYPPFVKDVIDAGIAEGINWSQYQPKLVFAAKCLAKNGVNYWVSALAQPHRVLIPLHCMAPQTAAYWAMKRRSALPYGVGLPPIPTQRGNYLVNRVCQPWFNMMRTADFLKRTNKP